MARQPSGNPGVKSRPGRSLARPVAKPAGGAAVAAPPKGPMGVPPVAAAPKPKVSPAQFAERVRAEAKKITWPSWKETWITSVMVFVMVALTSVFFLVVDGSLSFLANQFLKLAG